MYASASPENLNDCVNLLNFDLSAKSTCAFENELSLNARKSHAICFHSSQRRTIPLPIRLNNNTILHFDKVCNLGIMISDNGLLKLAAGICNLSPFKISYSAFTITFSSWIGIGPVHSVILYCDTIFWNNLDYCDAYLTTYPDLLITLNFPDLK